jgi:hypothetical protein
MFYLRLLAWRAASKIQQDVDIYEGSEWGSRLHCQTGVSVKYLSLHYYQLVITEIR